MMAYARFPASAAKQMITALVWVTTQRVAAFLNNHYSLRSNPEQHRSDDGLFKPKHVAYFTAYCELYMTT